MAGWVIEVTGLRQMMDALKEADKKASQLIVKEITSAGKAVAAAAAGRVSGEPVRNWGPWNGNRDLSFNAGTVAGGFKLRRSNFRKRGVNAGMAWDVYQTNAAGAIFELMGDGSRVTTPQGAHLVDTINARFPGKQPRILMPAYYAGMPDGLADSIKEKILDAARKAGLD